jgi:DNA-binding transcriptional regulator YiaG
MTAAMDMDILAVAQLRADLRSGRAREIRERAHLSLAEVARALGTDPSAVWGWESGRRSPRGPNAAKYASLLWKLDQVTREVR